MRWREVNVVGGSSREMHIRNADIMSGVDIFSDADIPELSAIAIWR